ncbi:MAG: TolC family protein [bacterium]|nr:TolC family protein [bacterium]
MKKCILLLAALAMAAVVLPRVAFAQRVLSLNECLDIGIERSTMVGSFRQNLQSSRQDVLRNYGGFLPDLTFSMYAGRNFVGPSQSVFVDVQGRAIDQTGFDHEQYSFSLNSNMTLFDWGSSVHALNTSKRIAQASEHDLQYQKDIVIALVIREYYNFVRRKNLRVVQEKAVTAAQRNLDQVEAFFRIGSNTRADVLQARVRLGNTQLELITATNRQELAKATLATRLNWPLGEDFDVAASLDNAPISPNFEEEVEYMLGHRSDLMASRRRVQAAGYNVESVENARFPTIAAAIRYSWNNRAFPENANFFRNNYSWSVGVFLNYNLFDRFGTKSSIINAQTQRRISEYNLQQAKLDAILEVKRLFLLLKEGQERTRVSEGQVTQAEENVRLANERYRVGAGTILETIEAASQLQAAQGSLIEAKIDYLVAKADLLRATGRKVAVE